jgi:hypothetical protein
MTMEEGSINWKIKKKKEKKRGKKRKGKNKETGENEKKKTRKQKENILFWSSLVFTTNMWTAFFTQQYLYSFLFASLTISSLVVHSYPHIITNLWDKVWIASIVIYGGYQMWNRRKTGSPWLLLFCVITFLFCVWVYIYGFIMKQYCFCEDIIKGNIWHGLMHLIGSLGHHAIIFLEVI